MPTFFSKDLRGGRKGRFMREILKDEKVKRAFDKVDEQNVVVEAVNKFAKPGSKITNRELAQAAGYLRSKGGVVNRDEEKAFEKIIKAGPRRIAYQEKSKTPDLPEKPLPAQRPITARLNEMMAARRNMPAGALAGASGFDTRQNARVRLASVRNLRGAGAVSARPSGLTRK